MSGATKVGFKPAEFLGALNSVAERDKTPAAAAKDFLAAANGDFSRLRLKSNPMAGTRLFGKLEKDPDLKGAAELLIRLYDNPATTELACKALNELLNKIA